MDVNLLLLKDIKLLIIILIPLIISGYVRGQLEPNPTLTALHLKKSEDYKKRPGKLSKGWRPMIAGFTKAVAKACLSGEASLATQTERSNTLTKPRT